MAKKHFEIEGLEELERLIKDVGDLPQKCVAAGARDGAKIALQAARNNAPVDLGNLKKGIIMKGERKSKRGKKVYDIGMDPKMRDVFSRQTATGKRRTVKNGKTTYKNGDYYYPASMEFGFMKKDGTKVPGHHFLRNSLTENKEAIEAKVLEKLNQMMDALLKKGR